MSKTSQGLIDLLLRHGVKPTYDSNRDIELGRLIMGKPYEVSTNENNKKK